MNFQGYKISIAKIEDLKKIMEFISLEWSSQHILSHDQDFFLYQYGSKDNLNFIVAKDNFGAISGILGFIPSSSCRPTQVFTTMWKVSSSSKSATLGLKLLSFLQELKLGDLMSVGINERTEDIYKFMKMHIGILIQYFIVNTQIDDYKIAHFARSTLEAAQPISNNIVKNIFFIEPERLNEFSFKINQTNKDLSFFKKRYCSHPYFEYKLLAAFENKKISSLMVLRVVSFEDTSALRIIDFLGDEFYLPDFARFLKQFIQKNSYEYVDFFCYGLNEENLLEAGFNKVQDSDQITIIPDHFDPFSKQRSAIKFFTSNQNLDDLKVFKGDGDQDCPKSIQNLN